MTMILDGSNGVTFNDASLQGAAASPYVLKNRIINGDMVIDQRNAGVSITPTTDTYSVDRWQFATNVSSKASLQQSSTAPTGFVNSLLITSTSAYTVGASEVFLLKQSIEGYNVADLGWGTANAKTITISFWVRSSLTGTFGGALNNSGSGRCYPFTYTISSANTWEQKTVTIAGDTSGTWLTTNGIGLTLILSLGCGSTFLGTANSWTGSAVFSATGSTNLVSTNGATFYITGVQLEQNTSATPFERRLYNQELANCQRYFEKMTGAANVAYSSGCATFANQPRTLVFYKTQKRAVPTFSSSAASEFRFQYDSSNSTPSAITTASLGIDTAFLNATGITISENKPCILISNSTSSYLEFSAEL